MNPAERIRGLFLKPREEWGRIRNEPSSVKALFLSYAMIAASVPPVAHFIGDVVIGRKRPASDELFRMTIPDALPGAVLIYGAALVSVVLLSLFIKASAPVFASTGNRIAAMKLAVYSMTPVWLARAFHVAPFLDATHLAWIPGAAGGLYGIYLLYLGLATPLMETPRDRVPRYAMAIVLVAAALEFLMSWILSVLMSLLTILKLFAAS